MEQQPNNKDRLKEITDSIERGIQELFESDKYKQYLRTMSRFHNYSLNNTILGDFCWAKEEEWLRIVPQFLGKKVLILGNHDLKQFNQPLKRQFQSIQDYKEITDTGRHSHLSL